MKPRPRKTANLSESIHQQLSMYALTASAAGVGALALASPAEAKVVYTPANVKIVENGGSFRFDLNHDGIADFALSNSGQSSSRIFADLVVVPLRTNKIWGVYSTVGGTQNTTLCAAALPRGTKVGPKGQFLNGPEYGLFMVNNNPRTPFGPWLHVKQAYLGIKFVIRGKTHFGWARVKVSINARTRAITATLTGYAYETIPGKPIIAGATKGPDDAEPAASLNTPTPEPATLGALAMGAPGLSIWRRKESVAATPESK